MIGLTLAAVIMVDPVGLGSVTACVPVERPE